MYKADLNPPLRSTRSASTIPGFFDSVNAGLQLFMKTEGGLPPAGTTPTFVHAFPKERLAKPDDPFDVITFRVLESTMAPTDNTGSRVPRAPSLRQIKPHSQLDNYNLRVLGWWELVKVEFSLWSKSSARADSLTNWFHLYMMKYAFGYQYFRARGVDYFRFVGRADDDVDFSTDQEVYRRRLIYEIRLETLDAFEEKTLESVDVNIRGERSTDTLVLTE
jgi:hypothetical protein